MEAIPDELSHAALGARTRLSVYARQAAAENAVGATGGSRVAMAGAAREAIFADALLAAMHARFEELRNAAK